MQYAISLQTVLTKKKANCNLLLIELANRTFMKIKIKSDLNCLKIRFFTFF